MPIILAVLLCTLLALIPAARAGAGVDADAYVRTRMTSEAFASLRQGGHVIVLSHGPAAQDENDAYAPAPPRTDCATQRALTDTGRLMASGIGKLLAREQLRVDAVLSSR